MKNNNENTDINTNKKRTLNFEVTFGVEHNKSDAELTPQEKAHLAFMQDYFCLSAVIWSIQKLCFFHKDEGDSTEIVTLLENNEYLCFIGSALLEDMSARVQREYRSNGGQINAEK